MRAAIRAIGPPRGFWVARPCWHKLGTAWRLACALFLSVISPIAAARASEPPPPPRWATFSDIVFRHFTPDTGLPFTGATALAQDRLGFLWVGSQGGLARWDGQRFRLYQAADPRTGLRDNLIKVLHVDDRGRLWVGTNAGGMARYDPATDRFVAYGAGPHGLSHAGVRAIEDDGRGGLWVATSGGLDHVDPNARTIRRYRHGAADANSLPSDHVLALLRAPGLGLWVGTRAGLALLDPAKGRFRPVPLPLADQAAVNALAAGGKGELWIGTVGAGAFRLDQRTSTIVALHAARLDTQTVTSIVATGKGQVWLGTAGNGIVIADEATGTTRRIVHSASVASSLADDAPMALFRDRSGAVWVATQRGLALYDPTRTGVWTLLGGTGRAGSASSQDVTALLAASDGRIWLGLGSHGVDIVDPARGTVVPLRARGPATLPPVPVSAFAELPDARVIIGTNAGLFASDHAGTRLATFGFGGRDRSREVTALLREGSTLWIGRLDGVWRLDLRGGRAHNAVRLPESDHLHDQRVMAIVRGPDGALWIGTQSGLDRLIPGSGKAERVDLGGTGGDGLVPTLLADRRGRIWAGVYGRGLVLIEQSRGGVRSVRQIGVAQGLPDANVDALLQDRAGRVWASTDGGLAMIDDRSAAIRQFGRVEAVAIAAYWTGSAVVTPAGDLLFGGLGGLTIIDPRQVAPPRRGSPLVMTEMRIGGALVPDALTAGTVTIRPDANRLFVEFATLDYADAASARYAYRLRNYQDDWTDADESHRSASFTNLPPGEYVLEIRSASRRPDLARPVLAIPIRVLPAWYQTLWFKLVLLALGTGVIVAIIQLRTAVLRRRQRDLEHLVAEHTAALRASQRDLEQIAYIDVLTGLPNRRMFNTALQTTLERSERNGSVPALLLIDLDHFKTINDTHGHDAGDALLAEVASRLQNIVREFDLLARLGGDEFAIVVSDAADPRPIELLCQRITQSIAEPVTFNDVVLRSGATIGIARFEKTAATATALYKASDLALYAAKRNRRGSWAWHEHTLIAGAQSTAPSANRRSRR